NQRRAAAMLVHWATQLGRSSGRAPGGCLQPHSTGRNRLHIINPARSDDTAPYRGPLGSATHVLGGTRPRYARNSGAVFSLKCHVVWCPKVKLGSEAVACRRR